MNFELSQPRPRARHRRRTPTRAAVPLDPHAEAGFDPLVHVPWAALVELPSRSYPLAPRASRARVGCADRAARPMALPPYRGHTTAHAATCFLDAQGDFPPP
jgi:hypothetical protein